jgi:single-stranded-DNA-specific exonuclease
VLPACPVVGPYGGDYPFAELCGTGVVYTLLRALCGSEGALEEHLDLVALATVADVVPLADENRALVAAGLRRLARTGKVGLRALMRAAAVDPATVDCGAVGFRLAPRINAAGRLSHPRRALELLLTEDAAEAERLAAELESLNRDRQTVEERILREALRLVEEWPQAKRRRRAYVIAGQDWHRGVVGIVASRLVERFHRPVVLVAGADDEEEWTGSGRSIPAFDLHAGLAACSELLGRWGGHRAAAGLSINPADLDAFSEAFADHAARVLSEHDLEPVLTVDAVVRGNELTLELCEELERLAPFGFANPNVTLLAANCELSELAAVAEGKHLRLAVTAERVRSGAIAFGRGPALDRYRRVGRYDVAFRLAANQWNGTVSPQLVVRELFETPEAYESLRSWLAQEWGRRPAERSPEAQVIFAELGLGEEAGGWRSALESPTFLAAIREGALPLAA